MGASMRYLLCGLVGVLTCGLAMIDPPASYLVAAFYAGMAAGLIVGLTLEFFSTLLDRFFP